MSKRMKFVFGAIGIFMAVAWTFGVIAVVQFRSHHQLYVMRGEAMSPTLKPGDRILVDLQPYRTEIPQRNDIIIIKKPPVAQSGDVDCPERVIGLPGDSVDLRRGKVIVNGRPFDEPYLPKGAMTEEEPGSPGSLRLPVRVPPDAYFVLGDNRPGSFDSRGWGFLKRDRIVGKMIQKY